MRSLNDIGGLLKPNLIILVFAFFSAMTSFARPLYIEGYLPHPQNPELKTVKTYLIIENGKIVKKSYVPIEIPTDAQVIKESETGPLLISPGFIDLHGHLKYHVLPIWNEAQGQFKNRFEWRSLSSYKKAVNEFMGNELFGSATDINSPLCQSVQYAEIKALIGGTTSVQGIGSDQGCTKGILARNVEIESDYDETSDIRVSTDLFTPSISKLFYEMVFPKMIESDTSFEDAYNTLEPERKSLMAESSQIRFLDLRNSYLKYLDQLFPTEKIRSFIVHLSEGRQKDQYNKLEYKIADQIGFAKEGVVMIHGVGLDQNDWEDAARKKMSLVWSPYSNLLLYRETADIETADRFGINISLGSDWSPTGSKNLLEEVKIAKHYLKLQKIKSFTDKKLFNMLTINPAKALKLDKKIGLIEENYLADIILFKMKDSKTNYYTQIVEADPSDIQAVFVKGSAVITNIQSLKGDNSELLLNENSPLAKAQQASLCPHFTNHSLVNQNMKITDLISSIKKLVPHMDDYLTCRDNIYTDKTTRFFNSEIYQKTETKPDSQHDSFVKLEEQLKILKNRPVQKNQTSVVLKTPSQTN